MPEIAPHEFWLLVPEMVLAGLGMALLVAGSLTRRSSQRSMTVAALLSVAVTLALVWSFQGGWGGARVILAGMFVLDEYAFFWKNVLLLAAALTILLSNRFLGDAGYRPGEYYALILLATTGMLLMVSGFSLLSIWISLELMALASYVLTGYFRRENRSTEAALKYFVLGALSSGILLYGVSLLYGATGALDLTTVAERLPAATAATPQLVGFGWLLLAMGLFFKVAAVPFHIWTPDVYVGAPTPVTAFLAAGSKAASFAILVRIFFQGLPSLKPDWQLIIAAIASLSMIWGNLAALTQSNVKRMLAYSSIAHAGYILMGVLAANETGLWALLFYLLAYTFITIGVFGVVILLERREYAGETYADYAGLAGRAPFLAAMMLVFLVALTGIPPTGGFVGKFYLFAAAVEAGWTWVAVIGVVTSAISLYYYIGLAVQMYLQDADERTPAPLGAPGLVTTVAICAAVTVALGIVPGGLVEIARASMLPLP